MIVCDTGPLVAAALSNDADHAACVRLFTEIHQAGRQLLVPATVVAEVGYLLAREAGPTDVATLDRRHFTVVRPNHANALTLLP